MAEADELIPREKQALVLLGYTHALELLAFGPDGRSEELVAEWARRQLESVLRDFGLPQHSSSPR